MNAARALARAGFDGDEVSDVVWPARPERIWLRTASPLVTRLWPEGIVAMTFRQLILVDPDLLRGDPVRLGRVTVHELVHVRQFHDLGLLEFLRRYLGDYLRGRWSGLSHSEAYRSIGLEEEARRVTSRLTDS